MAILDRIHRIARANLAHWLDRAETPEDELAARIRELEDAAREAKDALAGFAATYKRLERDIGQLRGSQNEWQARAEAELKAGNEAMARRALGERLKVEERIASLEPALQSRRETYDELREDLVRIHDQLSQTRARLIDLRARKRAAEAEKVIGQRVGSLRDGDAGDFERLEDEVMTAEAQVEIDRELRGTLTPLSEKLDRGLQDRKIDGELEALKRALAQGDPS